VSVIRSRYLSKAGRNAREKLYISQKRKQAGVAFPSAKNQEHVLIIRFNIFQSSDNNSNDRVKIRQGLNNLCKLLHKIDSGQKKIDEILDNGEIKPQPLSNYNFSSTIGFGMGFFEKLDIVGSHRPKHLKEMPNHISLGDSKPYVLLQTDFLIQLGSQNDYVNRWVFRNFSGYPSFQESNSRSLAHQEEDTSNQEVEDIYSAISGWAKVTDINAGFQRLDGKNLLGFDDGISNPDRLSNDVIWTTARDENENLIDGTYMVFQKIEHDLEAWQSLDLKKQEQFVGRSKATGLLLGTLSEERDRRLGANMHSSDPLIRSAAMKEWKRLYKQQQDPRRRFFEAQRGPFKNIRLECPVWSHVRKANPRQADQAARSIFRRGYLYTDGVSLETFRSGLLFICFQNNIANRFEYIKKNYMNNKNFPVPEMRRFDPNERKIRRRSMGLSNAAQGELITDRFIDPDSENTGREGLSGPSENGEYPSGELEVTRTLGGGYYFVPPIPNKKIADVAEQFFQ
jgi:Dyp-type peroxidase family